VDLKAEKRNGDLVRKLIDGRKLTACHDASDGGLLVAVAEMALGGNIGAKLTSQPAQPAAYWFGEDQARYVVPTKAATAALSGAQAAGVRAQPIGTVGGDAVMLADGSSVKISALRDRHEAWLPTYMKG